MIRRALYNLRHPWRRWGPRCGHAGPWRLIDCGPCILPRGHEHHDGPSPDWHADGIGFIWNDTRWQWMGPVLSLTDIVWEDPPPGGPIFVEGTP